VKGVPRASNIEHSGAEYQTLSDYMQYTGPNLIIIAYLGLFWCI